MIIGLVGRKFSGKDTAFLAIRSILGDGAQRFSFADPIKEALACMFYVDVELFHDPEKKEVPQQLLRGKTPRSIMQWFGTDVMRNQFADDFWIERMSRVLKDHSGGIVVITDVRFPNEAETIIKNGGKLLHINADDRLEPMAKDAHESEKLIERIVKEFPTTQIDNNGSLASFEKKIREAIQDSSSI